MVTGCQKSRPLVDGPIPVPDEKPWWTGMTLTEDGSRVILEEPITLVVGGVTPMHIEKNNSLRSVGSYDGNYEEVERLKSTVNSPRPSRPVQEDYSDFKEYLHADQLWTAWKSHIGGNDWVRDITIPELEEGDYDVEGNIPVPDNTLSGKSKSSYVEISDYSPYEKVTVTLYKLPRSRVLSFLVNSRSLHSYRWVGEDYFENIFPLSRTDAFLISEKPSYQANKPLLTSITYNGKDTNSNPSPGYDSFYLPMFCRLKKVSVTQDNKIQGLENHEPDEATPHPINSIYLERAVAMMTISWEYSYVPEGSKENKKVTPVNDHFFDDFLIHKYTSITSIIPNNWEALQKRQSELTSFINPYKVVTSTDFKENESAIGALDRVGTFYAFVPENFPTDIKNQTSFRVFITRFNPSTKEIVGEDRRYKYFDIPFGTKNANGIRETHRNTYYKLLLRFKQTPEGPVPYIVSTWDEVDIPAEL